MAESVHGVVVVVVVVVVGHVDVVVVVVVVVVWVDETCRVYRSIAKSTRVSVLKGCYALRVGILLHKQSQPRHR